MIFFKIEKKSPCNPEYKDFFFVASGQFDPNEII